MVRESFGEGMPEGGRTQSLLEQQFNNPEVLELNGEKVEVVDVRPESKKTEVPVVIAPGWTGTPKLWKENILELAQAGRETIAINAPHGISSQGREGFPDVEMRKVEALIQALEEKDIEQIDAIGHSEGGVYLAIAATLYPEKFRNIVFVDPGGMVGEDSMKRLIPDFIENFSAQVRRAKNIKEHRKHILDALIEGSKAFNKGPVQSVKEISAIAHTQIHDLLRELKQKGVGIAIIHGVDDKAFPMDQVQRIAKKDQLDGFYSVKGTHDQMILEPEQYTRLADQALEALENKKST